MTRPARTSAVAALLALTLSVAGCGDDPDADAERRTVVASSGPTGTTPSDVASSDVAAEDQAGEAPVEAYAAWVDALARHDAAAACALQAPEFTIALRYDAVLADRAELGDPCTRFEALLWEDLDVTGEIVDVAVTRVTEEDAILEVHLADDAQTVAMTFHRAAWRVLRIEDRAVGIADGWVEAWCELDPSMTREEIIASMGEPSGEYTVADGGEPQLWWAQDQYDFRVYLDVDGSVLELVGDYDALSAEDRALLPCPELRS